MTDIRQRLVAAAETARHSQFGAPATICMEAANEIGRLRTVLREIEGMPGTMANDSESLRHTIKVIQQMARGSFSSHMRTEK